MVNVKGEPLVKGSKCTMEKMSPRPRTITICHKEGCHLSKHKGYPKGRGKSPQQGAQPPWRTTKTREVEGDLQINNFMKQHGISTEQALNLMGNYYSHTEPVTTWEGTTKEDSVNEITQGF